MHATSKCITQNACFSQRHTVACGVCAKRACCLGMYNCVQLSNRMSNEALFYTVIFPFIAFFGAFAFVIYPNKDALHPTGELQC